MLQFLLISHFLSPLAPSCSRTPCSVSELPVPSDLILYLFGGFPFIFPPAFDLFLNTSQQQKAVKENSNRKDEKFDIFLNSDILPVSSREKGQLIFFISGLRRMEPWLLKRTMSPKGTGATGLFSLAAGLWKWSWGAGKEWGILGLLQGSIRKNHYQIQNPGTPPPPSSLLTQSALKAGRGLPPKLFGMEISWRYSSIPLSPKPPGSPKTLRQVKDQGAVTGDLVW